MAVAEHTTPDTSVDPMRIVDSFEEVSADAEAIDALLEVCIDILQDIQDGTLPHGQTVHQAFLAANVLRAAKTMFESARDKLGETNSLLFRQPRGNA